MGFAVIDTGRVRRSEGGGIIHHRHRAHLWHVEGERHCADINRLAGRVRERERELFVAVLELPGVIRQRGCELAGGHALDYLASSSALFATTSGGAEQQRRETEREYSLMHELILLKE